MPVGNPIAILAMRRVIFICVDDELKC